MSSMSVGGLLTGFDTKAVVEQLMKVERLAGDKITTAQTKAGALSSALTSLNGLVKSMGDAAQSVASTITSESIWNSATATSSNTGLATVTARTGAAAGSLTFSVEATATSGALIGATPYASKDALIGGDAGTTYSFGIADGDGKQLAEVSIAGGATIEDVAKAINETKSGVNATVVKVADNDFRLQLTSNKTGAVSNMTLTEGTTPPGAPSLLGSMNTLYNGTDAAIKVGDGANAYTLRSSSNTFTGVLPGLDVTVAKAEPGTPVTVQVSKDVDAMASKVQAMVDAANAALTNVRINSKVDPNLTKGGDTNNSGLFLGNSTARDITSRISDVFVGSSSNLPMLAGISIDRNGAATFDKAKFLEAYAKDPAAVEKNVTATAQRLADTSKAITNPTDGTLTVAIRGQDAAVKDYADQIKRFNDRMTAKQEVLTRQYDALDAMLSKLKSQGDWLAGQLKSLPTIESMKN